MSVNWLGVSEAACHKLGVLPKVLPSPYRIRIAQGRSPCVGVFLHECVRLQHRARITGKKIEAEMFKSVRTVEDVVEAVFRLVNE